MEFEKVNIIIGATDENESLIKTVDTISDACSRDDIDNIVIVIPESATEECLGAIGELEKRYPGMVRRLVQTHPHIGGAMRDSIDFTSSSHIMFLSADIPIGLEAVPVMIDNAKKQPDKIIKISRWMEKNSFYGYDKVRKIFNFCGQKLLTVLFLSRLTDYTCPVLIAPTHIYKNICFSEWNFPCLLEAVLIPLKAGCSFLEIPAKSYSRNEGKSKNSLLQTFLYLRTAFRIRFTSLKKLYRG